MIDVRAEDTSLSVLQNAEVPSELAAGTTYRVGGALGEGGLAVAFFAIRVAPDGQSPVVLKILKPNIVREAGPKAALAVQKEAVALGRLNEQVPPTPFVVRMIDTGAFHVTYRGAPLELPWIVIEYVHGGPEGTSLAQRVDYTVQHTGGAFDPVRAAHAIESVAKGLDAVHEVGVIHRDITPANVLCCGFGDEEMFKIADFGVARPSGLAATFGGMIVGTPGYAPPEQATLDVARISPASDVFAFAAVIYFLLTGEDYFPCQTPLEGIRAVRQPHRRSLTEARALSPELRDQAFATQAIDQALARGTATKPEERPQTAQMLAALVLPWLKADSRRVRASQQRLDSVVGGEDPTAIHGWMWSVRHETQGQQVVRSVAWDGDGSCLAASNVGLMFWNGTQWLPAPTQGLPSPQGVRFVHRKSPGKWLIGGDGGTLAVYSSLGVTSLVQGPDPDESFTHASGDLDDLAIVVGALEGRPPVLYTLSANRWLKPLILEDAASINSVARIADDVWLVVGRSRDGRCLAYVFRPLFWEVTPLPVPEGPALIAAAGQSDRGLGLAVAPGGHALWVDGSNATPGNVGTSAALSAAAVDVGGRGWAASAGSIWLRGEGSGSAWSQVWQDPQWTSPIVSLFADVGLVVAMTAEGAIVEGRTLLSVVREADAMRGAH